MPTLTTSFESGPTWCAGRRRLINIPKRAAPNAPANTRRLTLTGFIVVGLCRVRGILIGIVALEKIVFCSGQLRRECLNDNKDRKMVEKAIRKMFKHWRRHWPCTIDTID